MNSSHSAAAQTASIASSSAAQTTSIASSAATQTTTTTASAARGYVHGPFRIFHLTDIPDHEIPIHFHDFRKIVILKKGSLFYDIEGERYSLQDGDIVLVEAGEHHRPILQPVSSGPAASMSSRPAAPMSSYSTIIRDYDRIIIYLSDDYFAAHADADLGKCFRLLSAAAENQAPGSTSRRHTHVIRGSALPKIFADRLVPGLTDHFPGTPAEQQLMQTCRLTEFLLHLNLALTDSRPEFSEPITRNSAVRDLMQYLTEHLTDSLSIEEAAGAVHLDRSYLMHIFKAETGFTVMTYVTEKRLFLAQALLRQGVPAAEACSRSGFTNYTSFYRAYRRRYGSSPRSGTAVPAQVIHE